MAPVRSTLVVAAAAVSSVFLHGCMEAVTNAVNGYIEMICKSGVDKMVDGVEDKLIPGLEEKCQALRDKSFSAFSDAEKADGVKASCMDKGSVLLDKVSGKERSNWTNACTDSLGGMFNSTSSNGATDGVSNFLDSVNITGAYTDLVSVDWNDMMDKLAKDHGLDQEADVEGGEAESSDKAEGDASDDEAPIEDKFSMTPVVLPQATPSFAAAFLAGAAFTAAAGFLGRRVMASSPRSDEEQPLAE